MYKHFLSNCYFNKICPTMSCKRERNPIRKKKRHSLVRIEGQSATARTPIEWQKQKKSTRLPLNHVWNRWQKAVHPFGKHLCSFLKEADLKNTKKKGTEGSLGFGRQVADCGSVNSASIMTELLAGDQTHGQNSCIAFLATSLLCNPFTHR